MPSKEVCGDLLAENVMAIDHMGFGRTISLWQIGLQEFEPHFLAGISLCSRMAERFPDGFQPPLDVVVESRKELGK